PLIISPHESGFYGEFIAHINSLLLLNFEMGVLLPANSGIKSVSYMIMRCLFVFNSTPTFLPFLKHVQGIAQVVGRGHSPIIMFKKNL
ncbi:hypothetical protein COL91_24350, partial [Bacillus pseudomycoides]